MSRICVKNLPKHVSEDRLREVFSKKGEVTDAKLIRTEDRKSRQFAFVGFRTAQEAEGAINYFNNSYIDTRRIICEPAYKPGDPNVPRPWSRHTSKREENLADEGKKVSSGKSLSHASYKKKKREHIKSNENEDPKLQEFLQVMQPRNKSKLWGNDTLGALPVDGKKRSLKSDDSRKQPALKADVDDIEEDNENETQLKDSDLDVKVHDLARDTGISDTDYFKSRVKKDWSDSESGDEDDNQGDVDNSDAKVDDYNKSKFLRGGNKKKQDKKKNSNKENIDEMVKEQHSLEGLNDEVIDTSTSSPIQKYKKDILETGRLFVRNLPFAATEDDLEELFSAYGNVSQVHIIVDKVTKMSKGYGYVLFALPEAAVRAFEELDNSSFQGRLLHIISAEKQTLNEKQDNNLSVSQHSNNLKQRREEEKKASEASGNTKAWNSLFMRPDTVVENIARRHGISKSDLLDREADGLAAQIALGETQVIAETKKALVNAGVNVVSIEEFASGKADGIKRSSHVLLVKNLPYGSTEGELAKMFGKFGNLNKIILPPTKALALVVFVESAEARLAFKGLAYKRYKDAPLYLEWAPDNILMPTPTSEGDPKREGITGDHDSQRALLELSLEAGFHEDIDPDRVESRSLYVKNLNFKTSVESLKEHFNHHIKDGKILSLRIQTHVKNGVKVSKGFGFIEFDSVDTATNVYRDLQGTVLDGHALILQFCHEKKDENVVKKVGQDRSSTKLIVRNVAFEATEKDLRQVFSPFGQIKRLRLPKRFGNHRGFAFVEYVTKQETQNALQALSSTHLYGRHLVLERAKEGESLEELRARTAAQFTAEENGFQNIKKRKHTAIMDEGGVKFERLAV